MDHAEIRALLEEAFFQPGALRQLDEGGDGDDAILGSVREHLRGCADCRAELRSLRATGVALDVSMGMAPAAEERMLANVRLLGRQRGGGPTNGASVAIAGSAGARFSILRIAAGLLILLVAFGAGALLGLGFPPPAQETGPRLEGAAKMLGELLSEPDAQRVSLVDGSSAPAGLVVHSPARQELAVISSMAEPPSGSRYDCYLERDGERMFIGPMHFEGDTAFWAGPVGGPADAGREGDRFVVMLDSEDEPAVWGQF